ncbi:MAG: M56 family metallopeptidase [Flavisolibacter sp.]
MASWSQSHFLQALGWATLNSFWQMALLWCLFLGASFLFQLNAPKKYQLAAGSLLTGFAWFTFSFFFYFKSSPVSSLSIFDQRVNESNNVLQVFLISASLTYLSLLIFPSYRLFRNWQFVQRIKKDGLHKPEWRYRLFVQKISAQLGIGKKVWVFVSDIVTSPVTVGYLKPIILLPVAALNHLSPQQVEAVLLHELSHIRRYDYLINFMISIVHTLLYFNPFVKLFMRSVEAERENCCDDLVLQFGYDKVSYASTLLTLEKISAQTGVLAIAATGKHYLLTRIEKIVGMEKKKGFQIRQFAGVLAALFCIIAFNSILIIKEKKKEGNYAFAFRNVGNPFALFSSEESMASLPDNSISPVPVLKSNTLVALKRQEPKKTTAAVNATGNGALSFQEEAPDRNIVQVAQDEVDASLTKEQKDQVATTVNNTKKVMTRLQWNEIETQIADAMTRKEKAAAELEFKKEIEKINWKNVENNLKAKYEIVNWNKINTNLVSAMNIIALDSIQDSYRVILDQLQKAEIEMAKAKPTASCNPMPDVSVEAIKKAKLNIQGELETLKALRAQKKVVKL